MDGGNELKKIYESPSLVKLIVSAGFGVNKLEIK